MEYYQNMLTSHFYVQIVLKGGEKSVNLAKALSSTIWESVLNDIAF